MRVAAEDIDVALPVVDDTAAAVGDDNIRAADAVEAVGYNIQTDVVAAAADRYTLPFLAVKKICVESFNGMGLEPSIKLLVRKIISAPTIHRQKDNSSGKEAFSGNNLRIIEFNFYQ
nr:hypothetical protein Iba_chr14fCG7870 [Ipomoea batatas]